MIKKILLLVLLAAFAAVATEALSQAPGGANPAAAPGPASPKATDIAPAPSKTSPAISPSSPKSDAPTTGKDASPGKGPTATKESASKDASASKTFPTSSASPPGSKLSRKELVIDRCLVTLIDDNKVPATEAGMLTDVPAKEGHSVEKDALVAQIDSRSTLAKQKIAEAEFSAAKAQSENDAEVEVAEAAILVSKEEWEQSLRIRESTPQAVPLSQVRKDKFNYEKSLAQKKQAVNEKKIAGLTANAKLAQHEAASIEIDLRQIRSPFKGEVVEVMKKVGDWVTVGEPIMHIVGLDRLLVKGYVLVSGDEGASHDEVFGKPVTITVDAPGGKTHTVKGTIGFASPVIEGYGSDRQFRIWAEVDNETIIDPATKQVSWKIQPGSMAKMTIDLASPRSPLPARADSAKGDKGKVQSFKPVTGDEKSGGKTNKAKER